MKKYKVGPQFENINDYEHCSGEFINSQVYRIYITQWTNLQLISTLQYKIIRKGSSLPSVTLESKLLDYLS
jgi:hypothetical protein